MSAAEKRLRVDLKKIFTDPPPGVSAAPKDDDIFEWNAIINGPEDTPFEGGTFKLKIKFTPEYPNKAPTVWFYSKMFHPNVYKNGRICLDILEEPDKWLPDYDVAAILCGIQAMLGDPNPDSPANGDANGMFIRNIEEYEQRVREIVEYSDANINNVEDVDGDFKTNENMTSRDEEVSRLEDLANDLAIMQVYEAEGGF